MKIKIKNYLLIFFTFTFICKSEERINGSYFLSNEKKESLVVNGSANIKDSTINKLVVNGSCIVNDSKIKTFQANGSLKATSFVSENECIVTGSAILNQSDFKQLKTSGSLSANNTKIESLVAGGSFCLDSCEIKKDLYFYNKTNLKKNTVLEDENDGWFWWLFKKLCFWTTIEINYGNINGKKIATLKGTSVVDGNFIFNFEGGVDSAQELHLYDSAKIIGEVKGPLTLILHGKKTSVGSFANDVKLITK